MNATTRTPRPNSGERPSAITLAPNTIPEMTISFQTPAPSARLASGTATATAPIELADMITPTQPSPRPNSPFTSAGMKAT